MNYFKLLQALLISFAVSAAFGKVMIPFLRRLKFGQTIREEGPSWHYRKQGIPTMGGLIFILGVLASCLLFLWQPVIQNHDLRPVLVLLASLAFAFVGFTDDYIKVVKKRNLGLSARQKLIMQLLVSTAFVASLFLAGYGESMSTVFIPFFNAGIDFGYLYIPFAVILITGFANAVNLTDGIDGLATSVTIPVALFFALSAGYMLYEGFGILSAAAIGGLLGFLVYNFHPAKVFMGDTGSLFLGGLVGALAVAMGIPAFIFIAGAVYVIETLSVALQVIYFKATGGKRLFKMAPLHHHFELNGWSENRIVAVATAITFLLSAAAYFGLVRMFGV